MTPTMVRTTPPVSPDRWMIPILPRPETPGETIRRLRLRRGLSQEQVAADVGITQTRLSAYERDVYIPPAKTLRALNAYFALPDYALRAVVERYRAWLDEPQPVLPGPSLAIPDEPELRELIRALDVLESADLPPLAETIRLQANRPRQHQRPERAEQRPDRYDNRHAG